MMTGLINSTKGEATIRGKKVTTQMKDIRKSMGVCPQHDVLFADLTVRQHLNMFAIFKDVPSSKVKGEVEKIIDEVRSERAVRTPVGATTRYIRIVA